MAETTAEVNVLDGDLTVVSIEVGELEKEHSGPTLQCVMNPVREELISAEVQVDADVPVNSTQVYRVMDTAAYSKSCMEVESLCVSLLDAIYPILICGEVNMLVDQTAPTDNLYIGSR